MRPGGSGVVWNTVTETWSSLQMSEMRTEAAHALEPTCCCLSLVASAGAH